MSASHEVHVGFNVNFTHDALHDFDHLNADVEFQVREAYFSALAGTNPTGFAALCGSTRPVPSGAMRGHLGGAEAHRIATDVVEEYNRLNTGMMLHAPHEDPHCVRWEWIDNQLCAIYNYLAPIAACTECPPPGGTYHVVVCSPDSGS